MTCFSVRGERKHVVKTGLVRIVRKYLNKVVDLTLWGARYTTIFIVCSTSTFPIENISNGDKLYTLTSAFTFALDKWYMFGLVADP